MYLCILERVCVNIHLIASGVEYVCQYFPNALETFFMSYWPLFSNSYIGFTCSLDI